LSNEQDDLVLETNTSNEHWGVVLKIKKGEKLYKYCSESSNKVECNYPMIEKEIIAVVRRILIRFSC